MGSKVVLNRIEVLKPLDVYEVEYKKKPVYVFENELLTRLYTNVGVYDWRVLPTYMSNCGSIPWIGQKILRVKSFDPDNDLQNIGFFFHDDGDQKRGYDIFERDDVDAICRGILREAGKTRFQASTIDLALFLGARGHWGDNCYENFDGLSSLRKVAA